MKGDRQKKAAADLVTREYTVNRNKRLHGITFKKRAPRAARRPRAPQPASLGADDEDEGRAPRHQA